MEIVVETYSGFKADQRPVRFEMGGNRYEVLSIMDQWYSPDDTWFKVNADDGCAYILRHRMKDDIWTMESLVSPERCSWRGKSH